MDLTKHLGLFLGEEKLTRLFLEADTNGNNEIEYSEFEVALEKLKSEIARSTVNLLGVSQADLLVTLAVSVIFLLLLFAFIFIGISLFKSTSTLNTLVDSALPALAGIGLAARKEEDEESVVSNLSK